MRRTGLGIRGSALGVRDSGLGIGNSEFGVRGPGFVVVTVIVALMLFSSCKSTSAPKADEIFPRSGEVAGWAKSSATRTFLAENLSQYIDGDAERYLQVGVERTLTTDYQYQNKIDAVADIHIMKTAEGPRKLLEAESSTDAQHAAVGDEARLYPASLVFRKGRYLVRLVAYQEALEVSPALLALGRAIEKNLSAETAP